MVTKRTKVKQWGLTTWTDVHSQFGIPSTKHFISDTIARSSFTWSCTVLDQRCTTADPALARHDGKSTKKRKIAMLLLSKLLFYSYDTFIKVYSSHTEHCHEFVNKYLLNWYHKCVLKITTFRRTFQDVTLIVGKKWQGSDAVKTFYTDRDISQDTCQDMRRAKTYMIRPMFRWLIRYKDIWDWDRCSRPSRHISKCWNYVSGNTQ